MNTMTAKALTTALFEANCYSGKFQSYNQDDMMEWTMDVMADLMSGDLTAEDVDMQIAALDD